MNELRDVQRQVIDCLKELGVSDTSVIGESCLINDGLLVGYRLFFEQADVVWIFAENEVKIFSSEGAVLASITLQERTAIAKEAA